MTMAKIIDFHITSAKTIMNLTIYVESNVSWEIVNPSILESSGFTFDMTSWRGPKQIKVTKKESELTTEQTYNIIIQTKTPCDESVEIHIKQGAKGN